jgi:PKD repeat protein
MRVADAAGLTATADTTLTIYPANPVAVATANPNPAACRQNIQFDGSQSFHPNPNRSIASYQWDVNGDGAFDGGGPVPTFTYAYDHFGNFNVRLRVTDDLGRTADANVQVAVNQGNQPPTARASQANYVVLEGDNLTLDGSPSSDPNANCGDQIVAYEWDVNGNGRFDDAGVDASGARPVVPWAVLRTLRWPADRNSGLPTNTITLRVRDSFGATSVVNATITIFRALPAAVIVQNPDPAPINLVTGRSSPTLDGRESASPVPGGRIVRYDWDLDDDGAFEVANQPFVEFVKVFNPVPGPNNIPATFVRLKVTDDQGRTGTARVQVRYNVPPTQPTADADPTDPPERGYHILLGEGVTLDASQSSDPDSAQFGDYLPFYRWDVHYDAAAGADFDYELHDQDGDRAEARLPLTADQLAQEGIVAPGDYTVLLEVEDTTRLTNRDTAPLHVYARNPVAVASANPNPAACNQRVTFDGSRSDHPHPDINVTQWAWDLDGDGQYDDGQGAVVNYTYNRFTFGQPVHVGLRVTDSAGHTGTAALDMTVDQGNQPPVASAGGPYAIAVGENLALDGHASSDPDQGCGDSIQLYQWDLNADGTFEFSGAGAAQQAVTWAQLQAAGIRQAGDYRVALRVTDRFGVTATNTVQLKVVNGPQAVAVANPNRASCNQQVTFDGGQSRTDGPSPAFDIVSWAWDFDGDGAFESNGQRFVRAVVGRQNYTAALKVTDRGGRTSTAQVVVAIDVNNVPPVASAGGPYFTGRLAGGGFAPVSLDARASFDPNAPCDAIARYEWDVDGDGHYGDLVGAQVQYTNPNWRVGLVQVVRVRACDSFGACSNPAEADITVQNEAPPVGEIVTPRAAPDLCEGAGQVNVTFRVGDPEGDRVTVTALVGGQAVGQTQVATQAGGAPVNGAIALNGANLPEGNLDLQLRFDDGQGGVSVVNAGGRITFDRTPPAVRIDNLPDACYAAGGVPQPQITVTDALDNNPSVQSATAQNACQRTLTVTATDRCGNVGRAQQVYRIGEPVPVTINGADEGQLVARNTAMSWMANAPANCLGGPITATLARDGQAAANYAANTPIPDPGNYALRLTVPPCRGNAQALIRNFSVNAPPVAVAVPAGHPNARNGQYVVNEGAALQVDGSESRPPEAADRIARYEWDFNGDGQFDAQGQTANFPTQDDGVFNGRLRVTDSLGDTGTVPFRVTVNDVNPIVNAGGPYQVPQGVALRVDGSGSRAGSAADTIARYVWAWGDGTPDTSGPDPRPSHTYARNGVYNATLTVFDEDSHAQAQVRVDVADVDPVVQGVDKPADPYELSDMVFTAHVTPGAPADPITRYEWYLGGAAAGQPIAAGAATDVLHYRFRDAGDYQITLRVSDSDSETTQTFPVHVREITLAELLTEAGLRIADVRRTQANDDFVIQELDIPGDPLRVEDWVARGQWGERNGYRGNTLNALDSLTLAVGLSQSEGGHFGNLMWAFARQAMREVTRMRADLVVTRHLVGADDPLVVQADTLIQAVTNEFNNPQFEPDVTGNNPLRMRQLLSNATGAYAYLSEAIDPCTTNGPYELNAAIFDPVARVAAANEVNDRLNDSFGDLEDQMSAYLDAGGAMDPGPARPQVDAARTTLRNIRNLLHQRIGIVCDQGQCINDHDALTLEVTAMSLVANLNGVAVNGAWVRNWQSCLAKGVKFRIELSLLRVDYTCGANTAVAVAARNADAQGVALFNRHNIPAALDFYANPAQKCLVLRTYNDCLALAFPHDDPSEPYPAECANDRP